MNRHSKAYMAYDSNGISGFSIRGNSRVHAARRALRYRLTAGWSGVLVRPIVPDDEMGRDTYFPRWTLEPVKGQR
jgi:hypothetical protein